MTSDIKTIQWQGETFEIHEVNNQLRVLIPVGHDDILKHTDLTTATQAVNAITTSGIKIDLQDGYFSILLLPTDIYQQCAKIPEQFIKWAYSCARAVFQDNQSDAMVANSDNIGNIGGGNETDRLREFIHELLHTCGKAFSFNALGAKPFIEALPMVIARIIMDTQSDLPESTKFLSELPPEQINTVTELWARDSFAKISDQPINSNSAYASALFLGVGIMQKMIDNSPPPKITQIQAINRWIDIANKAQDGDDLVRSMAKALEISEAELRHGKKLQQAGQQYIIDNYHCAEQDQDIFRRYLHSRGALTTSTGAGIG